MERPSTIRSAYEWIPALVAFSIPLWPQATIILAGIWALFVVVIDGRNFKQVIEPRNRLLLLPLGYFLLLLIGMLWTTDSDAGWKECLGEMYIPVFPLLFMLANYTEQIVFRIKQFFCWGAFFASLICLTYAIARFALTQSLDPFFYTFFSVLLHPTYFGAILLFSLVLLMNQSYLGKYSKLVAVVNVIALILLSSKIIYLSGIVILVGNFFYRKKWYNQQILQFNFVNLFLVLSVTGLFGLSQIYFGRFGQVVEAIKENKIEEEKAAKDSVLEAPDSILYNSSTVRIAQLKYGWESFRSHPLVGVGTGDAVAEFKNICVEHHDQYGFNHFKLPHNFFIHLALMLGSLGVLMAFLLLFFPFIAAFRYRNPELLMFILMMVFVSFTDILTHATLGTFFAFIYGILLYEQRKSLKNG